MTVIDAAQRQQALDTSRSFIVQAPAGSGKTGVLTQRILKLLAQVERPEQILAITFTKKAAAEMRTRVAEALQHAMQGEPPQDAHERNYFTLATAALARDSEKGWNLLQNLGRLRLQTIDSLCSALVKDHLLTAGLGARFDVEDDASELYLDATRNLLASLDEDSDVASALFRVLQQFENRFGKVQSLIAQMLEQRDHWLHDVTRAQQDWDQFKTLLSGSLRTLNEEVEAVLQAQLPLGIRQELDALTTYAINNLHLEKPDHPLLQCTPGTLAFRKQQWQLFLTRDQENKGYKWRSRLDKNMGFPPAPKGKGPKPEEAFKARANAMLERLDTLGQPLLTQITAFIQAPDPELSASEWQLLEDLVLILRYAAAHLKLIFQQRHSVDFSEVALAALQALGGEEKPTDAMLTMDERIAHILVDEFQDTSFIQIDLLEKLTQGWMPGDGRTLFLVGDPMQSIYAFRKADVGLFLKLWHERQLGQVTLERLQLCMNFRSSARVLDWVNTTFGVAFPERDDSRSGAVQYAISHAARPPKERDTAETHLFFGPDLQQLARAEADWIAEQIDLLRHDDTIRDVAILVKGKSHILRIADALRKKNIPFQAVDIESLAESQVILDLLSLYQVCRTPGNRTAWFALLRGPWCGLSLQELETVAQTDPHPWRALQKLCKTPSRLDDFMRQRLQHLHNAIDGFYQRRLQQPFADALRELALQLGMAATARDQAEVEAIELFFDALGNVETVGGLPDTRALQKKLDKLFVPPEPLPQTQLRVQVMTMHKSKGLEFDVVFLPQLHRKSRRDERPLILVDKQTALLDQHQELFVAPATPRTADSSNVYEYLWKIHRQRAVNESVRLLYVACTRARQRLYLSGCIQRENEKACTPDSASLLAPVYPIIIDQAKRHDIPVQAIAAEPSYFRRPNRLFMSQPITSSISAKQGTTPTTDTPDTEAVMPDIDRASGVILHKILEIWARYPHSIPAVISDEQQRQWLRQLQLQGHDAAISAQGASWIRRALDNLLANPQRRHWLLECPHQDARAEYAISSCDQNEVQHWIIDRTFIADGIRHIIDYKLAEPSGDLARFLDEETERYRPQLKNYRDILFARDGIPCRTYLYFPLIDHLQEVET